MTAYINIDFTPIDKVKMQEYGAAVPSTLKQFQGNYLVKGPSEQLWGTKVYEVQVILTFPSKEQALAWYHSPEYQALVPLRNTAMDSAFRLVGE